MTKDTPIGECEVIATEEKYEEQHFCEHCNKTIYGNGEIYLLQDNTTPCLKHYHEFHEGEE